MPRTTSTTTTSILTAISTSSPPKWRYACSFDVAVRRASLEQGERRATFRVLVHSVRLISKADALPPSRSAAIGPFIAPHLTCAFLCARDSTSVPISLSALALPSLSSRLGMRHLWVSSTPRPEVAPSSASNASLSVALILTAQLCSRVCSAGQGHNDRLASQEGRGQGGRGGQGRKDQGRKGKGRQRGRRLAPDRCERAIIFPPCDLLSCILPFYRTHPPVHSFPSLASIFVSPPNQPGKSCITCDHSPALKAPASGLCLGKSSARRVWQRGTLAQARTTPA